ncbi:purine or other phosphorylase family 1 [Halothiobacillus neapolitanus]|uniref:Purine or other phosphorylase family 1 n=1 Tax=Halothiobacillus neapolitanus (strain ATCC 23641 / DSM 15147 / CIP 104769 / NCIMB 8539 / c2) TaxID=555778 RepID=D0KY74_HALNC|nr:purine or other phosphorylase family 1 [Halothiobacillus neapolitanus]ACX95397.1 purine or other phosphorylase family 1 [Halothiobacillus neapolitanus c2]TDN65695.1 adenosylhomocysteine nucleosidase [Halothiobacillus neapolitanus]
MKKNILLVMALPQENVGNRLDQFGLPILYTGVGKINAAIKLGEILSTTNEHTIVINLGSAGSHQYPAGETVCITRFFQHDMNATALGFDLGQTPFEKETHLTGSLAIPGMKQATCFTGDSFVSERHPELSFEVIDMEAYSLAKTCLHHNTEFIALKFITDGADGQAARDWPEALNMATDHLSVALGETLKHLERLQLASK